MGIVKTIYRFMHSCKYEILFKTASFLMLVWPGGGFSWLNLNSVSVRVRK